MNDVKVARAVCRLEIQGMEDVSPEMVREFGGWWRLALVVCATLATLGTVLASPTFLWLMVPLAAGAAIFRTHPVDLIYNHGIRHLRGTGPLPKRGVPTRLACGMGAVMLVVTAWAFSAGYMTLGYIVGGQLALVAILVATTDICLPSVVYRLQTGRSDLVRCMLK